LEKPKNRREPPESMGLSDGSRDADYRNENDMTFYRNQRHLAYVRHENNLLLQAQRIARLPLQYLRALRSLSYCNGYMPKKI